MIASHPAPRSFATAGLSADWPIVRMRDGTVFDGCNPDCVRARVKG